MQIGPHQLLSSTLIAFEAIASIKCIGPRICVDKRLFGLFYNDLGPKLRILKLWQLARVLRETHRNAVIYLMGPFELSESPWSASPERAGCCKLSRHHEMYAEDYLMMRVLVTGIQKD
ncbi:hypothetical protein NC651_020621 [Populus alba x Populus x berolinensis]|nr:hypothetical protein NC651_020621 [Populus alba x Populus x berolinensis]